MELKLQFRKLTNRISVSGQIDPSNIEQIKQSGFTTIVNNRPDGEVNGQPLNSEIEKEAKKMGLNYYFIPLGREAITEEMIKKTKEALKEENGNILCFCRTGTRSTNLWALSQIGEMDRDEIIERAKNAGYDLSHLAPLFE